MRDRADADAAPPGRLSIRGDADLACRARARDVGGVAVTGLHPMVVVAGRHEDDRLPVRRPEHALRVGGDECAPREHAEVDGLEVREERVVALDRHHGLPRLDPVAVVQRPDVESVPVVRAELQDRDRLVHPAEHGVCAGNLHHDAGVAAVGEQRRAGVVEVRVGVVALPHLLHGEIEHVGVEPLGAQLERLAITARLRPRDTRRARPPRRRAGRQTARPSTPVPAARAPDARARARADAADGGPSRRRSRPRLRPRPRRRARAPPAGPSGSARRERARGCARQEERPDEVAAAAVVLLRGGLVRLVGPDRDVLAPW